jgi:hypothetical protein
MCPPNWVLFAFCCDKSRGNSLSSSLYLLSCSFEDTVTILAGAERIIRGRRRQVNRKWPRWFTPNWVSNPSSVLVWGHAIIPEIIALHVNRLDVFCHFRVGTQLAWPAFDVVSGRSWRRPSVCFFLSLCEWFWCSSFLNTRSVNWAKPRGNLLSFQCLHYVDQWFPKRAVPPPGGRWDYRGGR